MTEPHAPQSSGGPSTILGLIKTRRSTRKFAERPIPENDLHQILEAGRWAPSGANVQPWRFVVVTRRDTLKAIAEACYHSAFKSRHVGEASVLVVICADPNAGTPTYALDCAIAGTNMTLMAHALGIGSCWIGAFEHDTLKTILNIPDGIEIIVLIAFGYPAHPTHTPPRLELDHLVHRESWDEARQPNLLVRVRRSGPLSVLRKILAVILNRR